MAYLQKIPLRGEFAEPSMFFLNDHGFRNSESCSRMSVWVGRGIQLFIDPETVVTDYPKLFDLIYDSGVGYGKWVEKKGLLNAMTMFMHNYWANNQDESDY
jgi:hypothetical protein